MLKIFDKNLGKKRKHSINVSRQRMIDRELLEYQNGFLRLTKKGQMLFREIERRDFKLTRPKRWDKKWRVLIFDIPEKRRGLRDKVRSTLRSIGFERLQDSVWVYPYDCEDLITLLKADFKIGKDLLYLIVDKIENDTVIRKFFGLQTNQ